VVEIDTRDVVRVGCTVRYRSVRAEETRRTATSKRFTVADAGTEQEVTVVASEADVGLYRLAPRAPLAAALLGHRVGDVIEVRLEHVRAEFEVTAISTPARGDGIVRVGSLVRVCGRDVGPEWWRIVPAHEADALRRCISDETPLARALMGRRIGDKVFT